MSCLRLPEISGKPSRSRAKSLRSHGAFGSKKRPHSWGPNLKEAIGRRSGIGGAAPAEKAARVERSRARNQEDRKHFVRPLLLLEEFAFVRPNLPDASTSRLNLINHWRDEASSS